MHTGNVAAAWVLTFDDQFREEARQLELHQRDVEALVLVAAHDGWDRIVADALAGMPEPARDVPVDLSLPTTVS